MRDLFPEARGSERAVVASTVHRFQGLEKDVILFDAVDGPPFSKAGVLLEGDAAARLINVAMSRARGKLIILGNRSFLQDRLSAEHPLNRLSRELEARGRIVDLRNVLDFQADGMGAAGEALAIVPIERADEADADEADADRNRAFRDDLRSAEELIVLRTDESARYDLFPELQALKDRGRKIVFLKARSDAPAVAASPEHIRQGWEVRDIPARYAGEEWALIDNRLLWYVSRERSSGFGIRVASSRGIKTFMHLMPPVVRTKTKQEVAERTTSLRPIADFVLSRFVSVYERCPHCGSSYGTEWSDKGRPRLACGHCGYRKSVDRHILHRYLQYVDLRCEHCGNPYVARTLSRYVAYAACTGCGRKLGVRDLW
ncbi:MAG: DNA helicase [Hydrogenibacillus schlegelii]|uniref:DNA helicase n=1 Tax=Hydrogenibacillus schlegelii TaxID=1484 RepID=A0A2T5G5V3_HYDSH|nr:MAG: DNA helicase [Hydrogenibacillus schlegelii]